MPLIFLLVGIVLLVVAVRGKTAPTDLITLLKSDFTGQNNFGIWVLAIFGIGALGYVSGLKPIANAFLLLVVVVILLSNKGFFSQFSNAVQGTPST